MNINMLDRMVLVIGIICIGFVMYGLSLSKELYEYVIMGILSLGIYKMIVISIKEESEYIEK